MGKGIHRRHPETQKPCRGKAARGARRLQRQVLPMLDPPEQALPLLPQQAVLQSLCLCPRPGHGSVKLAFVEDAASHDASAAPKGPTLHRSLGFSRNLEEGGKFRERSEIL